jgi:hypothetical protein
MVSRKGATNKSLVCGAAFPPSLRLCIKYPRQSPNPQKDEKMLCFLIITYTFE